MTSFVEMIGRVMMASVKLPRPSKETKEDLRVWAETEYKRDAGYAYHRMINGLKP